MKRRLLSLVLALALLLTLLPQVALPITAKKDPNASFTASDTGTGIRWYSNGSDHITLDSGVAYYIEYDDCDYLYKAGIKGEKLLIPEHVILMVQANRDIYLLVQRATTSLLLKLDIFTDTCKEVYTFDAPISNIAAENNTLLYSCNGAAYRLDLDTFKNETIQDNGVDMLYFDDEGQLKMISSSSMSNRGNNAENSPHTKGIVQYTPRLTAPATDDPYYTTNNYFYLCGYGMEPNIGNCTCYAFGRSYENLDSEPNLCHHNAGGWYAYNIAKGYYPYGAAPALGAVAVWRRTYDNDNDRGHVAVVEVIDGDTVITSESEWQAIYFRTVARSASDPNFSGYRTHTFQGFIYVLGTDVIAAEHNPVIYLEQPTVKLGNKVSVTGWAYDPDDPNASLRIDFYLDGQDESKTPLGSAYTGEYRPDVPENGIPCGPNQGFAKTIDTGVSGTHTLYAYVINIGEGDPFVLADNVPILTLEKYSGWKQLDGHWYYFHNDGTAHIGWLDDNGYWYYMKENGQMVLGWYQVGDYWYYFNESPSAEKPEGMMLTGWLKAAGSWFYLAEDGHMVTDWQQIDGHWYYFNSKGYMQVGWLEINGDWYYLDETSGHMMTGWIKMDGDWYYFSETDQTSDPIGRMATGWRKINGSWFYFDEKGHMMTGWLQVNGEWYYLDENGRMVTGWQEDNNAFYYLGADGVMLHGDAEIDGHTFCFADSGAVTAPGKPVLQALTDNIIAYEPISFSWNPTVNTTDYLIRIERQAEDESWQAYRTESVSVNDYESALPAGHYRVRVEAINGYLPAAAGTLYCTPGDWTLFAVADSGSAGHAHPLTEHAAVTPTCEAAGNRQYWSCDVCGRFFSDPEGINEIASDSWTLAPLGHEWTAPSYEWSDNYDRCTATAACKHDAAHIKTETVDASFEVIPSGCTEDGSKTYTAVFSDPAFETQTTSVVIQPLGHSYHLAEWIWTDFTNASAVFVCERDSSHAVTVDAKITIVRTEPSCTEEGSILYTATVLLENVEYTDTKVQTLDAIDHFASLPVRENDIAPTCTQSGGYDTVMYCAICNAELNRTHTVLEALGHVWDDGTVDPEPNCTENGTVTYTCMICGESYSETVPAAGHSPGEPIQENSLAPTCTQEGGYNMVVYCAVCHAELERQHYRIDAAGHTPGAAVEENRVSPTCTENGGFDTVTYCTVCSAELNRVHTNLSALGHDWNVPTYTWNADNTKVTASRTCKNDASHVETETVNTTSAVTKPATCTEKGETTYTAVFENPAFTKQTKTVANIDPTGHTPGTPVKESEVAPTCESAGSYDEVTYCSICKAELSRETKTINALGHDWNEPTYAWSADYSEVTAKRTCKRDESHVETETVTTTSEVTKPATTEEKGETTYTAVFTNPAFAAQTKTVANIDIVGLEWAEPTYVWSDDNSAVTATRVCTNKDDLIETETVNTSSEVTKPATCTEKGETTYTAEFENAAFTKQTKTVENVDALGHDYQPVVTAPTCAEQGYTTYTCSRCKDSYTDSYVDALGHDWNDPTYVWAEDNSTVTATRTCKRDESHVETETVNTTSVTQAATVDAEGQTVYTAVFENEAFETQTKTVILPKLNPTDPCADGHDWDAPSYAWAEDNSTVTATRVCKNNPEHTETETVTTTSEVTKEATVDEEGEITYTAVFTNPAFETQTKKVATPKLEPQTPVNPFEDVVEGKFYYDAVLWAVAHEPQITNGTDATHFSPDATCTRGQVVTFLWRAKGCPEPTKTVSPFTDVTGGFYYKAVLWAVENEITNGTSATTFGPNDGCTRGQVVTFLWRTEGQPEPTSEENPFEDVTGGFYYKAVLWAVENKITTGVDATHFKPGNTCTRGQIVTFLWRDLG